MCALNCSYLMSEGSVILSNAKAISHGLKNSQSVDIAFLQETYGSKNLKNFMTNVYCGI